MIDPELFRNALGRFASSVTVITTRDANGRDHGMTVSAFSSVSLSPPLVLVCIGRDASIFQAVAAAEWIGISVLAEEQETLSRRFAEKDADRFDDLSLHRGQHGVALLDGASAHLECHIVSRHDSGDHVIIVAAVDQAAVHDGRPLVYHRGGYTRLER